VKVEGKESKKVKMSNETYGQIYVKGGNIGQCHLEEKILKRGKREKCEGKKRKNLS
jgi:hypothetical protein